MSVAPRFVRLSRYLDEELGSVVGPSNLTRVKLALSQDVAPMSYHVAVARFGLRGVPLMDVIFDTTDSELNCAPFAHVVFSPTADALLDVVTQHDATRRLARVGPRVRGFPLPIS